MKKFKAAAIILSLLFVGAAGCTTTPPDESSSNPGADEDWQGNWTRPDVSSDGNTPEVHECANACYICGKCLTDCKEEVCAEKCYEPNGRTQYVFSGTDEKVIKKGGVNVNPDGYLGNINANANAEIVYYVQAEEKTTVCLGATISEMLTESFVTGKTPIFVNGETLLSRGYLANGTTMWTTFYTVWLGCVELNAGVNEIKLVCAGGDAYNFKDFTFLSDIGLSLVEKGGTHICGHQNDAGKCTDYTCNEKACLDKDETGWQSVELGAGDEKVLKYGFQNGNEISLWNANENCIGNIANGSIVGVKEQTVAFSFEATEEMWIRISLSTGTQNTAGAEIADMWTLTFNGDEVTTGAVNKNTDNPGWGNYLVNTVIYLKAHAGRNDFVMVHKDTNAGDNINNIIIGYEKGGITFVQAPKPGADLSVTGVSLAAEGGATTVNVGETLQLTATVSPSYAENQNVTFSSGDETVATVDQNGLVTAHKAGDVTITVTTEEGAKTATLDLTVTIPVSGVTLTAAGDATEITEGETLQLTATVLPENASNKKVTYLSSDTNVVRVDQNGLVTAISAGQAQITAISEDGAKTATLELTVNEKIDRIPVEDVTLATTGDATSLKKGETLQLIATVTPENATNKNVNFSSSDEGVATVDENGLVTAVDGGQVTITVTTVDGEKSAVVTLTVTVDVTSVTISGSATTIYVGDTLDLTATATPENATNKAVVWKVTLNGTEIENILTADGNGATFTPEAEGDYVITATAADGSEVCGSYSVTVYDPITGTDHFFEGEEAVFTSGSMGEFVIHRNDGDTVNARNNTSLGNVNANVGATLTYKVDAAEDCRAGLWLNLAFGAENVAQIFSLKVNGEDVAVVDKFSQSGANWTTYSEFWFANVELNKGINTIVLTVAGACGNYDYMTLKCDTDITTPSVVTDIKVTPESSETMFVNDTLNLIATVAPDTAVDKSVEWKVTLNGETVADILTENENGVTFAPKTNGNYVITATAKDGSGVSGSYSVNVFNDAPVTGTDHIFKGKDAALTSGAFGAISVGTDGTLGNINLNIGATVTYKVEAAQTCTAGLYCSLAFGISPVSNIFTLTVNGTEVSIPDKFSQSGANWTTYSEFWFANVELNKGVNTIVLTVTGACGNYDYMTLKCNTDITTPSVVTDIKVIVAKELLKPAETTKLTTTVSGPAENIEYSSSNPEVATVSADGTVTAVADGKATITVRSTDGSDITRTVYIFVKSGDGTAYEAENAQLTNVTIEAANGNYVGGINNAGAKVTFNNVSSTNGGKAYLRIYTAVVNSAKLSIDLYYTVKVNGVEIDLSGGQFAWNGVTPAWNTDNGYFTVEIDLTAGDNTIELISVGTDVQTNLDKIVIYE